MVGQCYLHGYGVPKLLDQAFEYISGAAEKGYEDAMYALATIPEFEEKVSREVRQNILIKLIENGYDEKIKILANKQRDNFD